MIDFPSVREALSFLERENLLVSGAGVRVTSLDVAITHPSAIQNASPGAFCWISHRRVVDAEALAAQMPALVLAGAPLDPAHGVPFATVHNPRLAFAMLFDEYFASRFVSEWPNGAQVHPDAKLAAGVVLHPGSIIGSGCEIGSNTVVGPNSVLANCSVGNDVRIGANCAIGLEGFGFERDDRYRAVRFPHIGRVRIGARCAIGSNTCIDRGALGDTTIGDDVMIDNLVHVAHNVVLEAGAVVVANTMLGGSVHVGARAWVAPSSAILNQVVVGEAALIGLGAVVLRDVPAGETHVGNPARRLVHS